MKKLISAFLMATCISSAAMANDLSPREALVDAIPVAQHVLETMEYERGEPFSDEEIRDVAGTPEFQKRLHEAILRQWYQQRLKRGPLKVFRA
ncbi:hypothetical protein K5D56_26340 [Pseudomonas cichorii]|nr:hypothetical protein [Pseudomonas cichorii]MBX8556957.1 hypothetical protein [Pseudomonas cichorii]MBX8592897.1 hypothetical protein [Pseudomonas cichorii]